MKKHFDIYIPKSKVEYRPLIQVAPLKWEATTSTNEFIIIPAEPRVINLKNKSSIRRAEIEAKL